MKLLVLTCKWTDCASTRKLAIPASFTLEQLHLALQDAFGWEQEHLYGFQDNHGNRWSPESEFSDEEEPADTTVEEALADPKTKLVYEYDFGDDNTVQIKRFKKELEGDLPICLEATGFMAVEDSAGFGYVDGIANILRAGPSDENYEDCADWLGIESPTDAEEWLRDHIADVTEINAILAARFRPKPRR